MASEIERLKRLPPDQRIRKLRSLIDKDKKELDEARRLFTTSEKEIQQGIDRQRMSVEEEHSSDIAGVVQRREEVTEEGEARQLEETLHEEEQFRDKNLLDEQYLRERGTRELYSIAANLQESVEEKGYASENERKEAYMLSREFESRREGIRDGSYAPTNEEVSSLVNLGESISKSLYNSTGIGYRRAA